MARVRQTIHARQTRWTVPGVAACVLLACSGVASAAQARCTGLRFEHLSVEQGLSNGSVHAIHQDQRGFLWLGTEDGLNLYDGSSITIFRHQLGDPNSLSSSNFGKIYEDESGLLWFGTWGGGLDRYDPATNRFVHYRHDPGNPASISSDRIEFLVGDGAGGLWIGTERDGLNRYDGATGTFVRYRHDPADPNSLPNDRALAGWLDGEGGLWVGTDGGLSRLTIATGVFEHVPVDPDSDTGLSSPRVRALAHRDGQLWIGTRGGGLNRLDLSTRRIEKFTHQPGAAGTLSGDAIARLHVDSNGTLWVATYAHGLNCYDGDSGFHRVPESSVEPHSLSGSRVESFYEDRSRNLWIGTRGGGVNRLDLKGQKFVSYVHDPDIVNGLPHPGVHAITGVHDAAGDALWIGTDGGGLTRFDRGTGRFATVRHDDEDPESLSGDRVLALLSARDGTLWVGTYTGGLNRRSGQGGFVAYRHDPADPSSLSGNRVQVLFEDRDGDVWAGTASGLNRVRTGADGSVTFDVFRLDAGDAGSISSNYITAIAQDRAGTLWFGTQRGLNAYDPDTGRFRRYLNDPDVSNSLASDIVQAVIEDVTRDGLLWVATEDGGLNRFDTNTGEFRVYAERDGLPSNAVAALEQDDTGMLWLSTSRGLSRFDPIAEQFRNYDQTDGLLTHSFIRNASWRSERGEIFFGSVAGLSLFHPDNVQDNPYVPSVVLTSFKKFNEEVEFGRPLSAIDELTLNYDDNFFSFEFAALDFTAPIKNQYAYMLEGVDPGWVSAGNRNYANYTGVDPGRYVFRVIGSNNDGRWNDAGTSIRLTIAPPFWQTLWFRAGLLLSLALFVTVAYQWRTRVIRLRNRRLQEINSRLNQEAAERRRAEAQRERFVAELESKNAELERFTYTVSHDLKTPLVTIDGFLDLIEIDAAAGNTLAISEDIGHLHKATANMKRLLDDLLELSRAGMQVRPPTRVALSEVVDETLSLLAGPLETSGVTVAVDDDMPDVLVDRLRLVEVFQNLFDNAVKFLGDQPEPRIEVGARPSDGMVRCRVRDNGVGIDPKHHQAVFGLFERIDVKGEGTGVGLALVRRIVEIYGGDVWVESEGAGRGTTFVFTLPAADSDTVDNPGVPPDALRQSQG